MLAALFLASRSGVNGLVKIISVNLFLFGFGIAGLAFNQLSINAYLFMFCSGFGMVASIAGINTLIQFNVDDEMRGRVLSFYAIALMGMNPLGSFLAGSSASVIGLKYTLLISGLVCIITGVFFESRRKKLKNWF
ncbi:MAG: MFS transporter [Bacteroidales bacterium]|nr:MFS transporter [Bacteroidales bacterium]